MLSGGAGQQRLVRGAAGGAEHSLIPNLASIVVAVHEQPHASL
jgi:hypothetical protein